MKNSIFKLIAIAILSCSFVQLRAGEPFDKGFTLKLAYIMPSADFGQFTISDIDNPFDSYTLKDAGPGFGLQLGNMWFLNGINIGEQFRIGIDVTWLSINYQTTTHLYSVRRTDAISNVTSFNGGEFDMYHIYFSAEVGPSFSYSPAEKIALDVSIKASPTFGINGASYDVPVNGGQKESIGGAGFGFRFTPAFYFRYSVLLVGAEYNIGDVNMTYKGTGGAFPNNQTNTTPFSSFRIVLGLKM